jgi:hypothetical protein
MISTNYPLFARSMSVPKEMNQLSVEAFTAGVVEAALDGLGFVSVKALPPTLLFCRLLTRNLAVRQPARVTAHSVPSAEHPLRTTILVKLTKEVMDREEALGPA